MNGNQLIKTLAASFCLFLACTMTLTEGTGEETTNGMVVGKLVTQIGEPAGYTRVLLIPNTYNPLLDSMIILADTTDSNGRFDFSHVKPGFYTILALHLASRTRAFTTGIRVDNDTASVPADTLVEPGFVTIALTPDLKVPNSYVYIPGTTLYAMIDIADSVVVLDSVPAGILPSVNHGITTSPLQTVIRYRVPVMPGETIAVVMSSWQYTKKLFLNTSPSGADVSGPAYNFPVLIRLTPANFDFSEAKPDGDDIRFTKEDNTPLPYEIEQWDRANRRAAIWVKVDTVYGNNNTHFIALYWGNAAAATLSNSALVFDTAGSTGFQGVWHLHDTTDATIKGNNVTGSVAGGFVISDGLIGRGMNFNGTTTLNAGVGPSFDSTTDFTVSAWVKTSQTSEIYLLSQRDSVFQGEYGVEMDEAAGTVNFFVFNGSYQFDFHSTGIINNGNWHLISAVRSGANGYIYIDGVPDGSASGTLKALSNSRTTFFAGDGRDHTHYLDGAMDEIRLSARASSTDWIKLCFMNQKAKDALVEFE